MGDVAMTVPVLSSLAKEYEVQLLMLTTQAFAPMFSGIPNLTIFSIDKKGRHKGVLGLFRLFGDLKKENPDAVADLHDVLRTKFLRMCFSVSGVKTAFINKGRAEKKALIKKGKNQSVALKLTPERYKDVFKEFGFQFDIKFNSIFSSKPTLSKVFIESFGEKTGKWIGIAPFAKHKGKLYPLDKMEKVIDLINTQNEIKVFLFGNGMQEEKVMLDWQKKYTCVNLIPKTANLTEELNLMSHLDLMLSMDSANMHLASLVGLPVISIWGATHYYAGFLGWNQSVENIMEIDLVCRPCSIYGNVDCKRKDYACLQQINPEQIYQKIQGLLKNKN